MKNERKKMAEQNAINNVQEWLQQQYTGGGLGM
jgi:hypothetical protein